VAAATFAVAMIVAVAPILLAPLWADFYTSTAGPAIREFFKLHSGKLESRNISVYFTQPFFVNAQAVSLEFVTVEKASGSALRDDLLMKNVYSLAASTYLAEENNGRLVTRIVFEFDRIGRRFEIKKVDFSDGISISL
jgi:hypothetical protein